MSIITPESLTKILKLFKQTFIDTKTIKKESSKINLTSNTSTVGIGIDGFDKTTKVLEVFVDGKYVEEGDDYTISEGSDQVTFLSEIQASSDSPVLIRFVVLSI